MAKQEKEFFDVDVIPWKPTPGSAGVWEKILSLDEESGSYTRMLKLEPGARIRTLLSHDFWEEVYIIQGSLVDTRKKKTFTKGMYGCRPPGMKHGPYIAPRGCLTIEVRYFPERYRRTR